MVRLLPFMPSRTTRRMSGMVAGTAGAQALVFAGTPVLTRLYSTADFGTLTVFTSVVGIVAAVSTLRLEMAIGLPDSHSEAVAIGWSALAAVLAVAGLTIAVGMACGDALASGLGAPDLAGMWWLVGLSVAVLGAFQVMSAWMAREERYRALGLRDLSAGLAQILSQVGIGAAGWKPGGLLVGFGMARLIGMGVLTSSGGLLRQPRPSRGQVRTVLHRYRRFPLIASWSALLNTVGSYVPLLVIAVYCDPVQAGLAGLAVRVLGAPSLLFVAASARVFYGETAADIRDRRPVVRQAVLATVRRLFLLGLIPSAVLVVFGAELFGHLFGTEWQRAGTFASILSVGNLARFAVGGITQTLLLLEREVRQLRWDAIRLLLTVGPVTVCLAAGARVDVAIAALSASLVVAYGLLLAECLRAARQFDLAVAVAVAGTGAVAGAGAGTGAVARAGAGAGGRVLPDVDIVGEPTVRTER